MCQGLQAIRSRCHVFGDSNSLAAQQGRSRLLNGWDGSDEQGSDASSPRDLLLSHDGRCWQGSSGVGSAVRMAYLSRDSQRAGLMADRNRDDGDAARMTLPRRRSDFRLRIGPCRALGADTPRDAELRGDLACSRLGSERKYVKRIYARDTGEAGRQFAR